jgi:hypothetical protein
MSDQTILDCMASAVEKLAANSEAGKWTLISPDGRVWMSRDPLQLIKPLAQASFEAGDYRLIG